MAVITDGETQIATVQSITAFATTLLSDLGTSIQQLEHGVQNEGALFKMQAEVERQVLILAGWSIEKAMIALVRFDDDFNGRGVFVRNAFAPQDRHDPDSPREIHVWIEKIDGKERLVIGEEVAFKIAKNRKRAYGPYGRASNGLLAEHTPRDASQVLKLIATNAILEAVIEAIELRNAEGTESQKPITEP